MKLIVVFVALFALSECKVITEPCIEPNGRFRKVFP